MTLGCTPPPASIYDHALTVGFPRAFEVAAGIGLLAVLIAIATIRVRRQELSGAGPDPQQAPPQPAAQQPATAQPATVQLHEDRVALAAAVRPCRRLLSRRVTTWEKTQGRPRRKPIRRSAARAHP